MAKKKKEIKAFSVRMPMETWRFLKSRTGIEETSMIEIIVRLVTAYQKKVENNIDKK